jgi:hypothetical protein
MEINLLRYALLGALTVYGPEYAIKHMKINPCVTSARIDNIFTIRYSNGFSFEFIFNLDADNLDFQVKMHLGSHDPVTIVRTPMDCHINDTEAVFNRVIESCFMNLAIEYQKLLGRD